MRRQGLREILEGAHTDRRSDEASIRTLRETKCGPGAISASRRVVVSSLLQYDSCPSHDDVGGFFFDFEAIRTDLTEMLRAGPGVLAGRAGLGAIEIYGPLASRRGSTAGLPATVFL